MLTITPYSRSFTTACKFTPTPSFRIPGHCRKKPPFSSPQAIRFPPSAFARQRNVRKHWTKDVFCWLALRLTICCKALTWRWKWRQRAILDCQFPIIGMRLRKGRENHSVLYGHCQPCSMAERVTRIFQNSERRVNSWPLKTAEGTHDTKKSEYRRNCEWYMLDNNTYEFEKNF